ncbi:MAG: D-alanine--D-alanine ligase [Bdellovibrionaceae bacterium]|nr:D-alanine--D-alanine ligase [Pseudobdellovibrionaceae bacterium]|tara:strand:+ start:80431 stop:81435 length:1005 start_codon:yes stop_codon:yes gene_type:complete
MKRLKILLLCHHKLIPSKDPNTNFSAFDEHATEQGVYNELCKMGHEVEVLGPKKIDDISESLENFPADLCFNLMEEFDGDPLMDSHIVSYLEMLKVAYTGNGPKGLLLARDKSTSKKILEFDGIPIPAHFVVSLGEELPEEYSEINFPMFVKSRTEEASLGISQASIVRNKKSLQERVKFIHEKVQSDAIVDEFIDGRELYLGILGNENLSCFPIYEMDFGLLEKPHQKIATEKIKWNEEYRKRNRIDIIPAKLSKKLQDEMNEACKKAYRKLELKSYARFDLRLKSNGDFRIIEANPNPNIAEDDEFAIAAKAMGIQYSELLQSICDLALEEQ